MKKFVIPVIWFYCAASLMLFSQPIPFGGAGGAAGVSSLNSQTGAVTIAGSGGILVSADASTVTIDGSSITGGSIYNPSQFNTNTSSQVSIKSGAKITNSALFGISVIDSAGSVSFKDPLSLSDATITYASEKLAFASASEYDFDQPIVMLNKKITGVATPTVGTDAVNKTYADGLVGGGSGVATNVDNVRIKLDANTNLTLKASVATVSNGVAIVLNAAVTNVFKLILTNNVTLTITNLSFGEYCTLMIHQDTVGSRTLTGDGGIEFSGGMNLTSVTGPLNVFSLNTNAFALDIYRLLGTETNSVVVGAALGFARGNTQ